MEIFKSIPNSTPGKLLRGLSALASWILVWILNLHNYYNPLFVIYINILRKSLKFPDFLVKYIMK